MTDVRNPAKMHDRRENHLRVVRIYFRLPPEPGGMEEHIARLSEAQRACGLEVINIFNSGKGDANSVQVLAGTNLLKVRPAVLRNLLFYVAASMRCRHLRAAVPTMVHAHGDWSDFLFARFFARFIHAEGKAASFHGRLAPARSRLYRWVLRGFDPIFTTGKADQEFLETVLGRAVHHLPSSPRPDFFSARPQARPTDYDVIGVANFFWEKAPEIFVECAKVRPGMRFILIGDGPARAGLVAQVRDLRLTNVELPGRLSTDAIIDALERSRLFLSTSLREGTPTAALEAMATGLPVVLTPSNDYRWLINPGENGFISTSWEPLEIVQWIDRVLADEPAREAMGNANRRRVMAHSWQRNADKVTALMRASLAKEPCA